MISPYDRYDNYYIAYLDILGFKDMIDNKPCSYIWDVFNDNMTSLHLVGIYKNNCSVFDVNNIHMKVMSDSVIFYIKESIENSFLALVLTCLSFQIQLLTRKEPILTRGAIVCGKMFVGETAKDSDVMFGPGFVEAYKMQEFVAKVPRIITTKMTVKFAIRGWEKDFIDLLYSKLFLDYDEYFAINYLGEFKKEGRDCERLLEHVENTLSNSINPSIRDKYLYLKNNMLKYWNPQENQNV